MTHPYWFIRSASNEKQCDGSVTMQLLCHYMIGLQQVVLAGVRELKPL